MFAKTLFLFAFVFINCGLTGPTMKKDISTLDQAIDVILSKYEGTFAIAYKDIDSGQEYFRNEREIFHAASTMKTPVMLEIFHQQEEGKLSLGDSVLVINKFTSIIDGSDFALDISDDSGDRLYSKIGSKESVKNLIVEMITVSSNFATNLLIEKIGAENVMKTLKKYNVSGISVLRGVEDSKAFEAGKNNTTTALGLMRLFELLAAKGLLPEVSRKEMIDILLQQKFNEMIPAKLPPSAKVAHKTGSITNVQHDSGIIFLPDGRKYILVVLSKNLKSNSDGQKAIAEISKAVYDFTVK